MNVNLQNEGWSTEVSPWTRSMKESMDLGSMFCICPGNPDETRCTSLEIASKLRLGHKEKMEIFKNSSHLVGKFLLTKELYCYGNLPFQQKGC